MIDGNLNHITLVDDVFSPQECEELIVYYEASRQAIRLRTEKRMEFVSLVSPIDNTPVDAFAKSKVLKVFGLLQETVQIQRGSLERRDPGAYMNFHTDNAYHSTAFTSVTYLNDDFEGGRTIIRPVGEESDKFDTVIVPRRGRTIFYNGARFLHRVTEVEGIRYTMPLWYKAMPQGIPDAYKWWKN